MMALMAEILDRLKKAIRKSGKSRYRLARESGIAESALSRLVSGERGLSIEAAEKLALALDLEIIIRPAKRKAGKTRKR